MKLSKEQGYTIGFFIIGLLIMGLFFDFLIPQNDKNVVNFISIIGTYLSIYGLIVAYLQIISIKRLTEITNEKVQETKDRINQLVSITHIAKGVKLADEVQHYIKSKKFESAHLRLKDLKVIILECEVVNELDSFTKTRKFKSLKNTLFVDIDTLSSYNGKDGREINLAVINSNIENISTTLIEFENQIKAINL